MHLKPKYLLNGAPYTKSTDMGPEYLQRKFKLIRREIEAQKKVATVTPIKTKARK